ncbi:MAG: 3-oxoacyl-ACP reductase FabG [Myxococcales bacterium]|nr:3-oxoacyl-ACP reductase FabG [Myxococcales bacterium]
MERFAGKVVVITGGAQGIGWSASQSFAKEGAFIAIWDYDQAKGEEAQRALEAAGHQGWFQRVNVADQASVDAAATALKERCGRVDVLINNAGITRDASLKNMSIEQWQQVIDVNLTGVFLCTKALSAHMTSGGRVINTSSVVGLYGNYGQSNYVATKSGVIGVTKVWARELGRKGITVNAVAPGFIATEMISTVPEKVVDMMLQKTPVGRLGKPEDIANAYMFLASEEASFINGVTLSVDGGLIV